jgi:hypothetical protein
MAVFYFDRETGKRVSKATWSRSKSHGGSRYVRRGTRSTPREGTPRGKARVAPSSPLSPSTQGAPSSAEAPRTWQDYEKQAREKLKKRGKLYDDFDYDNGVEYETGVDY